MATLQLHHNNNNGGASSAITLSDFNDAVFTLQRKTPLQLQTLEHLYSDDKNPPLGRMEDYASALGLTCEQVRRWFVDRRRRDKRGAATTRRRNKSTGSSAKSKCRTNNKKSVSNLGLEDFGCSSSEPTLLQDMLYPPEYILQRVFRKDGPPLGVEFDTLPSTAFQGHRVTPDNTCSQATCQDEQGGRKRRKVSGHANVDSQQQSPNEAPMKKHGMGKGLMSIMQLANSQASRQKNVRVSKRSKVLPCRTTSTKKYGMGKGLMTVLQLANRDCESIQNKRPQRRKPVTKQRRLGKKLQEKRKPPVRQRKKISIQNENQKTCRESCKLALDLASYEDNMSSFAALADDEKLEMMELQAGPNPLTCSAHFSTGGTHGCSLCKGLLPKFPPVSVRMRKPLCMHPWNSSLELVKKLFKVFHFLYTYAVIIDICPFTFDEFTQAFHEKDSLLLGKLHMCLLGFLLSDIETELSNGLSIHSSKNCMFRNLLHSAEKQKSDFSFWKTSLNPLTWTEILRQVLVAAGFGSKDGILRKECHNMEAEHIIKYGLSPGTLKGELFSILLEQGYKGMKVNELANSSRIVDLNLAKTNGELEDIICSTLAGDITLFEKISSSAYRLRLTSIMKKDVDIQSDNEDCGSIDDESRDSSINDSECDSGNPTLRNDFRHRSGESNTLSLCTEIDESHSGESWLLGLMEGEYSDLSIEEKLNALLALIDLLSAGSSIRLEDPSAVLAECVPSIYQHGTGGKIKRASSRQPSLATSSWFDVRETCGVEKMHASSEFRPVDSSLSLSMSCGKDKSSVMMKDLNGIGTDGSLHPMQSVFLGSDRRYNRYWLFLGPCDTDDPGHTRVYFESSEDGHWAVIESEEALCGLLASLNSRGRREAYLLASLERCSSVLIDEISSRVVVEAGFSQPTHSDISEIDRVNECSPSPISDIDNNLSLAEISHNTVTSAGTAVLQVDKVEEQKQKYARKKAYDLWIWNSFYSGLNAAKNKKQSYFDSLTRCGSCNDLYWRDERHCKTCHVTFELDFDLEEKYAIHMATCQGKEDADVYPTHKILPSQIQALKAAIHAIELALPEDALVGSWKKSAHRLWVRRLRRTSSLHELSQVLADFVGAINVEWLSQCYSQLDCDSALEDIVACFQNMPQTSSAVALWVVKLDSLVAPHLNVGLEVGMTKGKRNR